MTPEQKRAEFAQSMALIDQAIQILRKIVNEMGAIISEQIAEEVRSSSASSPAASEPADETPR